MASINPTSLSCAAENHTSKHGYIKLTITSISDSDAETNQRYIGWKLTVEGTRWVLLDAYYASLGGTVLTERYGANKTDWHVGDILDSGTATFNNDSSGNLTLNAYVKQIFYYYYSASRWNDSNIYQDASTTMVCSQLPRYANFTSHYVSGTGLNTLSVHWEVDANCDYAQYSLNGGAWTDGASWPNYTLRGLSPNTQYNVRTRVRRTDSQLWTTSGYIYGTTKSLPSTGTPSNFNIGSNTTISISSMSNLSHWYVNIYDGSTLIKSSGNLTSTSVTINLSDSTIIDGMLSRHTNTNSWTLTFKYYCVSNGVTYTLTERTCTCSIPSSSYLPTFNANNISYEVIDQQSLDLTGSNKKVIGGISNVRITCSPASPNGHATMSSYSATSGSSTGTTTDTSSPIINLTRVSGNSVVVQAIDSRSKSTSAAKSYDTYIEYFSPTITYGSITRIDGVGSNLNVSISGKYCNWSGLSTTNIISQVSLQYKLHSASSYTTITGVNLSITNSNGTFTATGIITGDLFNTANEYDVLITLKDKINTIPYAATIPTGKALLWRDVANNRIGINKKPECALDVNGQVNAGSGGGWIASRDKASIKNTSYGQPSGYSYNVVASQKTNLGEWSIGNLSGSENLYFSYTTDEDYNNGTNAHKSIMLPNVDGTIALLETVYPVGAIYMSMNGTNPHDIFGFGTWVQISGKFLWATGSTPGQSGGSQTQTLSASNIPSHRHSIPQLSGTTGAAGGHSHTSNGYWRANGSGDKVMSFDATGSSNNSDNISWVNDHSHSLTTNASNTGYIGDGTAFSIMPPYYEVYMWRRTA